MAAWQSWQIWIQFAHTTPHTRGKCIIDFCPLIDFCPKKVFFLTVPDLGRARPLACQISEPLGRASTNWLVVLTLFLVWVVVWVYCSGSIRKNELPVDQFVISLFRKLTEISIRSRSNSLMGKSTRVSHQPVDFFYSTGQLNSWTRQSVFPDRPIGLGRIFNWFMSNI